MGDDRTEKWINRQESKPLLSPDERRWPAVVHDENGKYVGSLFVATDDAMNLILSAPKLRSDLAEAIALLRDAQPWTDDDLASRIDALLARHPIAEPSQP